MGILAESWLPNGPPAQRLRAGAPTVNLTWQPLGQDDEAVTIAGTVTATVTRSDGTTIVTAAVTTGTGSAPWVLALTGAQVPAPELLTVVWLVDAVPTETTVVELVGSHWSSVAKIRQTDETLRDGSKYSNDELLEARTIVEDQFERVVGARRPRFGIERFRLDRSSAQLMSMQRFVRSVRWARTRFDGGATSSITVADVTVRHDAGIITRDSGWSAGVIEIGVEYGTDRPTADLLKAFHIACRVVANNARSGVPPWATSTTGADGKTFGLAGPGRGDWETGIREVDNVLARYRQTSVLMTPNR